MICVVVVLVSALGASSGWSGTELTTAIPTTKSGQMARDWLKLCAVPAIGTMTKWAAENFSEAALKREPAEDQAREFVEFCKINGDLRVTEVTEPKPATVTLQLFGAESGMWYKMELTTNDSGKLNQEGNLPSNLAAILPINPPESSLPKELSDAALAREVSSTVARLSKAGLFSGIVSVARGTSVVASASAGYANREKKTPISGATQFTIGSMGKLFTAVAVGQLVDQKKVSFDDKVGKFFPEYPNRTVRDEVTVGMLLAHTAGMGDFLPQRTPEMNKNGVKRAAEFMPLYDQDEPKFKPGTSWAYSNAGLALAGAIVEKASGENYPEYLRRHIFAVAGMTHSDPNNVPLTSDKLATPYTQMTAQGSSSDWHAADQDIGSPAGGAISTADDLVRFAEALRSGTLISKSTFAEITKPHDNGRGRTGYAIGINTLYGRTLVGHTGGFPGVNTSLRILLDSPYTLVVLANQDPPAEMYPDSIVTALMTEKAKLEK